MDKQLIEIVNVGEVVIELPMLIACLTKVAEQMANSETYTGAEIVVAKRKESGWLEFEIVFHHGRGAYTIGAIQRTLGAEFEFHS